MSKKMNPLLKHSIALVLSTAVFSSTSYAASCSAPSTMNWNSTSWTGCAASGPVAGDSVFISSFGGAVLSLNGVDTPALSNFNASGSNTLNDAGAGAGSLTTATISPLITYNVLVDFTHNNSALTVTGGGITIGYYWGGTKWLSGTAKFGTGAVTLAGDLAVHPDEDGPNTHGKFTMSSGGTLEFTAVTTSIKAYQTATATAVITLQGTSSTPLVLKSAGTTTFTAPTLANTTGAGTYNLDYVHFATGTWVVDSSVTITEPPNCTYAAGATPPAAWTGCTSSGGSSAVSASVNLNSNKKPELFSRTISLEPER